MTATTTTVPQQCYITPPEVLEFAAHVAFGNRYSFGLDVAAEAHNHRCPLFIGPPDAPDDPCMTARNGLTASWYAGHNMAVWCNPPFKDLAPWLRKAARERNEHSIPSCVLTHAAHAAEWSRYAVANADAAILLWPRINYIDPRTGKVIGGNTRDSILWVFDPANRSIGGARIIHAGPWNEG